MLGIHQRPVVVDKMIVPPVRGDLKLMSIGFFLDDNSPVMWRGPMLHKALEQFLSDVHWGELDTLLVDMPPGHGRRRDLARPAAAAGRGPGRHDPAAGGPAGRRARGGHGPEDRDAAARRGREHVVPGRHRRAALRQRRRRGAGRGAGRRRSSDGCRSTRACESAPTSASRSSPLSRMRRRRVPSERSQRPCELPAAAGSSVPCRSPFSAERRTGATWAPVLEGENLLLLRGTSWTARLLAALALPLVRACGGLLVRPPAPAPVEERLVRGAAGAELSVREPVGAEGGAEVREQVRPRRHRPGPTAAPRSCRRGSRPSGVRSPWCPSRRSAGGSCLASSRPSRRCCRRCAPTSSAGRSDAGRSSSSCPRIRPA